MTLKEAVTELYFWQYSRTGSFHNYLYDLLQKADESNKQKLAEGFPTEREALQMWEEAGDYGNDLFRVYGLMK